MATMTVEEHASDEKTVEATTAHSAAPPARHASVGQSIAHGALALLSTQPLTWAASLLSAVMVPRLLGADALGQVTVAITICQLASTVTGMGVSEYLVRRVAQRQHSLRRDAGIALAVQMIAACLGTVLVALLARVLPTGVADYTLLLVALVPMLLAPAQTVLLSNFRGSERHASYALLNAGSVVGINVATVLVLLAGGNVVGTVVVGDLILTLTLAVGWKMSGLRPILPPLNRALLGDFAEFIRGGLPFLTWMLTLAIIGGTGFGIDRLMLGLFVPAAEVGWYAAAARIMAVPLLIPTLVMNPLFPALSRSVQEPETIRRTVFQTIRLILLVTIPFAAGALFVAPFVPSLLHWPADFANATPLMMLLGLDLPLLSVDMVLGVVVMAIGREGRWVRVGIAAAILNAAANLVGIPYFEHMAGNGAIASPIALILTELLMFGGALLLIPKHLLDPRILSEAARIFAAGAATGAVGIALAPAGLVVCLAGAAVTYLGAAIVLRALRMEDVRFFKRFLKLPSSGHAR